MKQLDEEWFEARRGLITGSRVATVVNGGPRAWNTMLNKLAKEKTMTGAELAAKQIDAASLSWGRKYEPIAKATYELMYNIELDTPAFITNSAYPGCGYSPDGRWPLPQYGRLVEIKCPYRTVNHGANVLYRQGVKDYQPQMQFGNMITMSHECDFVSFDRRYPDPDKRIVVIPVKADPVYIHEMESKITMFLGMLESGERFDLNSDKVPELF